MPCLRKRQHCSSSNTTDIRAAAWCLCIPARESPTRPPWYPCCTNGSSKKKDLTISALKICGTRWLSTRWKAKRKLKRCRGYWAILAHKWILCFLQFFIGGCICVGPGYLFFFLANTLRRHIGSYRGHDPILTRPSSSGNRERYQPYEEQQIPPSGGAQTSPAALTAGRIAKPPLAFSSPKHYNEAVMRLKA